MVRPGPSLSGIPGGQRDSRYRRAVAAAVDLPAYQGPFDVLLQLVSEHKVDVYDIPLAQVIDAFLASLAEQSPIDLEDASEFLVIAAILVELKSRKLLPGPDEVEDDEELSGFDERDRLLARLYELQAYAAAADAFVTLIERSARSLPRIAGLEEQFRDAAPDLLAGMTAERLAAAYLVAMAPRADQFLDLSHVTVEAVTVSEAVGELEESLPQLGQTTFRQLTSHCTTRMQVIVRFLALLELCKRGWVTLDQGETFGDLAIIWVATDASRSAVGLTAPVEEYDG